MSAARDGLEVHLRLHPESLGDVRVNVRWERGALTAHLEVATPAAREALEGGLGVLRTTLNEQGVPVERLHVTVRLDVEARSQGQQAERQAGMVFGPPSPPAPRLADEPEAPQATPGRLDIRI
jgi:flagellar hook-length control protein FliK